MARRRPFLVLIGSSARGEMTERSDIDLVAIGRLAADAILGDLPRSRKANLIQFSFARFDRLYRKGDLFILHVLSEGKLLRGPRREWLRLVKAFKVKTHFRREISRNQRVIGFLLSDRGNLKSPIAFLSNLFRALKQIAIFRLAEQGTYVFSKSMAVKSAFPWISARALGAMLDAEHILMRENHRNRNAELPKLTRAASALFDLTKRNRRKIL